METKIKLKAADKKLCQKFASSQISSSKNCYSYRGESRSSKILKDINIGKLGEIAAYRYLVQRGFLIPPPDFNIYERSKKSFDADLTSMCGNHFHVKSQGEQSIKRYGKSWLFQKNDKITRAPTPKDWLVFTSISDKVAEVLAVFPVRWLVERDLFGQPRVPRYRHSKLAVYLEEIEPKISKLVNL